MLSVLWFVVVVEPTAGKPRKWGANGNPRDDSTRSEIYSYSHTASENEDFSERQAAVKRHACAAVAAHVQREEEDENARVKVDEEPPRDLLALEDKYSKRLPSCALVRNGWGGRERGAGQAAGE